MRIKGLWFVAVSCLLTEVYASESWSSIGSSISGFGESIWSGMKGMAEGMIGQTPSGYNYNFQVFNGSLIPVHVAIDKAKNIMGARFAVSGGGSVNLAPGQDSGTAFHSESLYFAIKISGSNLSYQDDHYQLGQKDDSTVYYYHVFTDKDAGTPAAECLGGGYTTSSTAFGCRIENKLSSPLAVTFTITGSNASTFTMTVPDLDPGSFTYLQPPAGCAMNGSSLQFFSPQFSTQPTLSIPAFALSQITSGSTTQVASSPVTYNYVATSMNGAFMAYETGLAPGNFDQPANAQQLRDISPVECQITYQSASQAGPIGSLLAQDIAWESVWYFYTGYGWSQEAGKVVQYPCAQLPRGQCASCFLIRPSVASQQASGPGRFVVMRLNIPEAAGVSSVGLVQQFFTKMIDGQLEIIGLSTALSGGSVITKTNSASLNQLQTNLIYPGGLVTYPVTIPFSFANPSVAYPPLQTSQLGASVVLNSLSFSQKQQLMGTELPENIGLLQDPVTGVSGYMVALDSFTSYGMGSGPFYYTVYPPYFDISQMLGIFMNYIGMCGYSVFTSTIFSQIQSVLAQTVINWVAGYYAQPQAVAESIASFLVLIAQQQLTQITSTFGQEKNPLPTIANALNLLSPQGNAFLKLLLYGPASMSQLPVYYKAGSMSLGQSGTSMPVTVQL